MSLTGTFVRQTYPGPPDYESLTRGDEPRIIWVLLLDRSVCAVDPNPRLPREYYETELQLLLSPALLQQSKTLLGKKITMTGALMHGGAKYDKRLVLEVEEMRRAGS